MGSLYFCVTVDDVGLDDYCTPLHLRSLLRFWDEMEVKGTLFVVPRCEGKALSQMPEYVDLLQQAVANGHEIAQHGLDHTRFQTGIPPKMVLDLPHEGPARQYLAEHRDEITASLSVDNLKTTLATGRELLESALGLPIHGFRAPCLSTCSNLFQAIAEEHYLYDSSCVLQESAWQLICDPKKSVEPLLVSRKRFDEFQISGDTTVLPIAAEYTWYLKRQHYKKFLALAKHDVGACIDAGIPFVPVSHVSPIQQGDVDCGFDLYRELIGYARQKASELGMEFHAVTMSQSCSYVCR